MNQEQSQSEAQAQIDTLKQQLRDLQAESAEHQECEEFYVELRNPNPDDPFNLFVALPNVPHVARAVLDKDCE